MRGVAVAAALLAQLAYGRTILVTPDDAEGYRAIEAAVDGDVVLIAPGTYHYRVTMQTPSGRVVIRARDARHWPVFDYGGNDPGDAPGSVASAGACWLLSGAASYELYGLVVRGCGVLANAQTVRVYAVQLAGADRVTVRGAELADSVVGLGGVANHVLLEHLWVHDNASRGVALYGGQTTTLRYSTLVGAGSLYTFEAIDTLVEYCWLSKPGGFPGWVDGCEHACGGTGTAPLTQHLTLRGNVISVGAPVNTTQVLVFQNVYGASTDLTGQVTAHELVMVGNTVVGASPASGALLHVVNTGLAFSARLDNNVLVHVARLLDVDEPLVPNWSVSGAHNFVDVGAVTNGLTATVTGGDAGFRGEAGLDFHPLPDSPLVGAAAPSDAGLPDREYWRDEQTVAMFRARPTARDLGAFEAANASAPQGAQLPDLPVTHVGVGCGCGHAGASLAAALAAGLWASGRRRRFSEPRGLPGRAQMNTPPVAS